MLVNWINISFKQCAITTPVDVLLDFLKSVLNRSSYKKGCQVASMNLYYPSLMKTLKAKN